MDSTCLMLPVDPAAAPCRAVPCPIEMGWSLARHIISTRDREINRSRPKYLPAYRRISRRRNSSNPKRKIELTASLPWAWPQRWSSPTGLSWAPWARWCLIFWGTSKTTSPKAKFV